MTRFALRPLAHLPPLPYEESLKALRHTGSNSLPGVSASNLLEPTRNIWVLGLVRQIVVADSVKHGTVGAVEEVDESQGLRSGKWYELDVTQSRCLWNSHLQPYTSAFPTTSRNPPFSHSKPSRIS